MTTSKELKAFSEYTDEELKATLPPGQYHIAIHEAKVNFWDDGRPHLDINTTIKSGELKEAFGPRHTWNVGGYSGVTGDGRAFSISEEKQGTDLVRDMRAICDGVALIITDESSYDENMLSEIARQIVGLEAIVTVRTGKRGYDQITKFHSISDPESGLMTDSAMSAFSV